MTPDPDLDPRQDDADPLDEAPDQEPIVEDPDVLRAKAAERDEYLERLKRERAEFQNYKARVGREKADIRKFVTADVFRSMLPVLDNLERAVAAVPEDTTGPLLDGVRIVIAEFHRALEQNGVKPVKTDGVRFDPTRMEAVTMIQTDEADENSVLDVFEKGYQIDDFVIRPARVSVAAKKKAD